MLTAVQNCFLGVSPRLGVGPGYPLYLPDPALLRSTSGNGIWERGIGKDAAAIPNANEITTKKHLRTKTNIKKAFSAFNLKNK